MSCYDCSISQTNWKLWNETRKCIQVCYVREILHYIEEENLFCCCCSCLTCNVLLWFPCWLFQGLLWTRQCGLLISCMHTSVMLDSVEAVDHERIAHLFVSQRTGLSSPYVLSVTKQLSQSYCQMYILVCSNTFDVYKEGHFSDKSYPRAGRLRPLLDCIPCLSVERD